MSAPLIWILSPILIGAGLLIVRGFRRLVWIIGTAAAFGLAISAELLQIGSLTEIGPLTYTLEESFQILGRQFVLINEDLQILSLIFLLVAIWFLLTPLIQPDSLFIPVGLMITGIMIAALTVDPFLYAALFIEMIVLLSIPLLVPPGMKAGMGVMRFLTYETLGVPFILYSDWMLAGSEASPGDFDLVIRAAVLLGVGFAFFLAIFPFHSWVPMLFDEAQPYVVAFVAVFLFLVVTLFGLELFNRYVWLRNSEVLFSLLRITGLLMVLFGGVWAGFSERVGRAIGFGILTMTGLTLLAFSLGLESGLEIYFSLARTLILAVLVWSASLYLITGGRLRSTLDDIRGFGRISPVLGGTLVLACLTMAGYPFLAGFPRIIAILEELTMGGIFIPVGTVIGLAGLAAHGVRLLRTLFSQPEDLALAEDTAVRAFELSPAHWTLLLVGVSLMILIGML